MAGANGANYRFIAMNKSTQNPIEIKGRGLVISASGVNFSRVVHCSAIVPFEIMGLPQILSTMKNVETVDMIIKFDSHPFRIRGE